MTVPSESSDGAAVRRPGATPRRVLYVLRTNPAAYPPVEHGAVMLAERGCDVCLLGVALVPELSLAAHSRLSVHLRPAVGRGWRQKVDAALFVFWVASRARRFRPDWIYSSDPLSTPAAWVAAVVCGASIVYHEHDAPEAPAGPPSIFARLIGRARRAVARRARLCVVPSAGRAAILADDTGVRNITVIWNTPLRRDVVAAKPRRPGTRLLFHGSIVPARVPDTLLYALARLPGHVSLRVTGYDPAGGEYVARLMSLAGTLGISDRIAFGGAEPTRAGLMEQGASCDVGVALLPLASSSVNERTMVGASNKPFDYMACGLALLVSDLPEWTSTFVEPGFGRACDPGSVDSLVEAIRWFDDHRDARREMGEKGRRRILETWNYDVGFEPVLRLMTAV
jgi:glycosyltransferase involved in cell wall biosynthesis